MKLAEVCAQMKEEMGKVIVGKEGIIEDILTAFFAGGHVLLEDSPGSGKTMLAKSLAACLDAKFSRIQFTPDLLPTDITGLNVYNQKTQEFNFVPGPAFTNILLADEINRATPRTQSALLECMEEKQITVDGKSYKLERPFFVIATENPIESMGTYPLPEAQLDRFMMKLSVGYPNSEEECTILKRFFNNEPLKKVTSVISIESYQEIIKELEQVRIKDELLQYITDIVAATRSFEGVLHGVSPRGSIALMRCAAAYAATKNRDYVIPDDIKHLAVPVLAHRIIGGDGYGSNHPQENCIRTILDQVPVPTENWEE